jgi:hypothetical protein
MQSSARLRRHNDERDHDEGDDDDAGPKPALKMPPITLQSEAAIASSTTRRMRDRIEYERTMDAPITISMLTSRHP